MSRQFARRMLMAAALGAAVAGGMAIGAGRADAAPREAGSRTIMALTMEHMVPRAAYPLGVGGPGQVCATQFLTDGDGAIAATIAPITGGRGTLVVELVDAKGNLAFDQAFNATDCVSLSVPAGGYSLRPIRWVGAWRLEVTQN